MTHELRCRLRPLLVASFFAGFGLWIPIEKLFLTEIGFTPETIGVMAAAYAIVVPLLEVPSGILADRWSRRGVLIIGNVGMFVSVLVGGLSTNVVSYVVAALLLGVYFAMNSGTIDAIVYDTVLEETGASDRFEATIGRVRMADSLALVLGGLGGGVLAALASTRFTYFATLPFVAGAIISLLAFREPRLHRAGSGADGAEERQPLREHVATTFNALRRDAGLLPVAGLLVLTAVLTQLVFEFGPLWLVDADAGTWTFGPAWAALMASLGVGGFLGSRLRLERPGRLGSVVVLLVAGAVVLLVSNHPAIVTTAQVVLAVLGVAIGIVLTRVLHDAVPSTIRSGVASGVGALTWLTFLPFALAVGWATERWGIRAAGWLLVGVVGSIAVLLASVVGARRDELAAAGDAVDAGTGAGVVAGIEASDCGGSKAPARPAALDLEFT